MAIPQISELVECARNIVLTAGNKGKLNTLTHRKVRHEMEKQLSLDEGALDAPEYKKPLKSAITEAVEEARRPKHEIESPKSSEGKVKPKKGRKTKAPKEEDGKEENTKKFKSAEFIVSDGESDNDVSKTTGKSTMAREKRTQSDTESENDDSGPSKKTVAHVEKADHASRGVNSTTSSKPTSGTKKRTASSEDEGETSKPKVEVPKSNLADERSGTELSDLVDEPPKKKRASKKSPSREQSRPAKGKKSAEPLGKDEETIKRLKSLVVACGVRKVWSKVFQGMDKPSQQIRKLKEMLSELGMTGRLSMEQAKAIREKRELAQEIEDVQNFERSVVEKNRKKRSVSQSDSEVGDEEDGEGPKSKRRKGTARQNIMAFLQDQSESE